MLFSGQNTRIDYLKSLDFLRPISFASKGNITGIQQLESRSLQAGTIRISNTGNVSGVRDLHATGIIKTDATLELAEFTTGGKVQAGGPLLTAASGYVSYRGVGSDDTVYGKSDPYYTRKYPCIIPDVYPPQIYVWSLDSDDVTHLTITQGENTYVYVFPIGRYTSSDICYTFNHTLYSSDKASPLIMSYDADTDKFTITVDDTIGEENEPPPYYDSTPNYKKEFTILGTSLLLQRLGFFATENIVKGIESDDITSESRTLSSTVQTAFKEVIGFTQGYYSGGVKNDDLSPYWSPATHVWVGPETSQTCKYKVIKAMNNSRMSNRVGNEFVACESLSESNIFRVNATLTSPYFTFPDSDTPFISQTIPSEPRAHNLPVFTISNKGFVTLMGTDSSEVYNENGILCGGSLNDSILNIRSRNPKHSGTGPSISFEGAKSNCSEATESASTYTTYASIKGVPASTIQSEEVDEKSGGQLIFFTTPDEGDVPLEAMRINEKQQVYIGVNKNTVSRAAYTNEKLYVNGDVYTEGDVGVSSCIISPNGLITSLTSVNLTTGNVVVIGESFFNGPVNIVSSKVDVTQCTATLTEELTVVGPSTMTGVVDIVGPIVINGTSVFTGDVGISSCLAVNDSTTLNGPLHVNGTSTFNSPVDINSSLTVSDITTLESDVDISGSLTVSGTSTFDGPVGISTSLTVSGDTALEGDLDVEGDVTINASSTFNDIVTINSTVELNDTLTANKGVLFKGGESIIYNTTYTDPDVLVSRSLKISGDGLAVSGGTKTDTLTCYDSSTGTYVLPLEIYAPNNTGLNALTGLIFGTQNTTRNVGKLGFKYTLSGSTSNKIVFQFGGDSHDLLSLKADHTAEIDALTVNGDITVNGKVLPTGIISTVSLTSLGLPTSDTNLQSGERIRLWGNGTTSDYSIGMAPNTLWLTSNNTIAFYINGVAMASINADGVSGAVPVGTVTWVAFNCVNGSQGQTTVPKGYLVCNGAQVSRVTYSTLYATIGTIYGSGNGSTTFNIPDLRGSFIRGYNNSSSGYDPSRSFGSFQSDDYTSHSHSITVDGGGAHDHGYWASTSGNWQSGGSTKDGGASAWIATEWESDHSHNASCSSSGGSETRPYNLTMVALIRYY